MASKPTISAIAAIGKNRELGKNGNLIWRIKEDMRHFKDVTKGHPIIMGRKTFESIGKPLPNRTNIIITRNANYKADGCIIVQSVEDAIEQAKKHDDQEIFIIGGAEIYKLALPLTDRLYLTIVDAEDNQAHVFFPNYSNYKLIKKQELNTNPKISIQTYQR